MAGLPRASLPFLRPSSRASLFSDKLLSRYAALCTLCARHVARGLGRRGEREIPATRTFYSLARKDLALGEIPRARGAGLVAFATLASRAVPLANHNPSQGIASSPGPLVARPNSHSLLSSEPNLGSRAKAPSRKPSRGGGTEGAEGQRRGTRAMFRSSSNRVGCMAHSSSHLENNRSVGRPSSLHQAALSLACFLNPPTPITHTLKTRLAGLVVFSLGRLA